jgi:hypothetical protein
MQGIADVFCSGFQGVAAPFHNLRVWVRRSGQERGFEIGWGCLLESVVSRKAEVAVRIHASHPRYAQDFVPVLTIAKV